ncbi:hypothetical protein N7507_002205 [Penicillium longicatenatum]|nr:hypothetical protein N7507_002205 [Penicillium longicatenatum]
MEEKLAALNHCRKPQSRLLLLKRWTLLSLTALFGLLIVSKLSGLVIEWRPRCGHRDQLFNEPTEPIIQDKDDDMWQTCGDLSGSPVQCSSIEVPMDQFDPVNSGNKTFTIPLIRLPGKKGSPTLLTNPGGPGGSGFEFLYRRGEQLKALIGDGFHIVSFDPRGVNSSTPTSSCYPDAKTRDELSRVRAGNVSKDSSEVYAWTKNFAQACHDTMGEYGKYINTPQTAADMNSILDALGQDDMFYWGFSYGTLLGQTYAGLFPKRSKRVVIDGVVNQFEWYEKNFELESMVDTDSVLYGFFDECMKAGTENCELSALATSTEALRQTVVSYLETLQEEPISVYINNSAYGLLDYEKILYNGIFPALYKPSTWFSLADNLYKLIQGNATNAFLAYGTPEPKLDESNDFVTLNDGLTGLNHWPQGKQEMLDWIMPWLNQSLFISWNLKSYYLKQHWNVPRIHSYVPRKGVETAHPLLILSTTYDPVCPLISAHSAKEAFLDSQIVEVKGYGHCSIAVASTCAAKILREFLYEGKLPSAYTQCEVDSQYFVRPDNGERLIAHRHFEDPEDEKIHLAQLALARDWDYSGMRRY